MDGANNGICKLPAGVVTFSLKSVVALGNTSY